MDDVKVTYDPSIGHPNDPEVTEWQITRMTVTLGTWWLSGDEWVRWPHNFSSSERHIVAIPVARKPKPKFKIGDAVTTFVDHLIRNEVIAKIAVGHCPNKPVCYCLEGREGWFHESQLSPAPPAKVKAKAQECGNRLFFGRPVYVAGYWDTWHDCFLFGLDAMNGTSTCEVEVEVDAVAGPLEGE